MSSWKKIDSYPRDLLNYYSSEQKYDRTDDGKSLMELDALMEQLREVWKVELEKRFHKRTEDVAKEWKGKLYEMVHKYEGEQQDGKLKVMAKDKYELEKKLIVC